MIRKRPEKDTVNPPGQITYVPTLDKSIEQWKNYEHSRNRMPDGCCHQTVITRCPDCPLLERKNDT